MTNFVRRFFLLCAAVIVTIVFVSRHADVSARQMLDIFDRRPARTVLIIGNSRTYAHGMPSMVREMADSAQAPVRYDITLRAWAGASFEQNWKDARVQELLKQHWDYVILQAESRAQVNGANQQSFETYGEKLVAAAKATGSPVAIIVNWTYGESLYVGDHTNERARYLAAIQSAHRGLAQRSGAKLVNTGSVWEKLHAASPRLPLYEDGNHPTIYGSYLSALMIYGFIAGGAVADVSFRPSDMDEGSTQQIKQFVDSHYRYEAS